MRQKVTRPIVSVATIVALLHAQISPAQPRANTFSDIGNLFASVTGLKGLAEGIFSGAASGVRSEFDGYIKQEVEPLLARADAILQARVQQIGEAAQQLVLQALAQAETALRRLIHEGEGVAIAIIREARGTLRSMLDRFDDIVRDAICSIGADSRGIVISLPLLPRIDEIRIRNPKNTQCYSDLPGEQGDPSRFAGWQYYEGELCEAREALRDIDPADPSSIIKMSNAYADLAARAKQAQCHSPVSRKKRLLMQQLLFEKESRFFASMACGDDAWIHGTCEE